MTILWSGGTTRVFHTGWTENGQPTAPWKLDNGEGTDPVYCIDWIFVAVDGRGRSDFNQIPRPKAWVEYKNVTVWKSLDGTIMLRGGAE